LMFAAPEYDKLWKGLLVDNTSAAKREERSPDTPNCRICGLESPRWVVPKTLANLWANANSMPFGSPSPMATYSAPNVPFISLNFPAIVSSASSHDMRVHAPAPFAPVRLSGCVSRSGWLRISTTEAPFLTGHHSVGRPLSRSRSQSTSLPSSTVALRLHLPQHRLAERQMLFPELHASPTYPNSSMICITFTGTLWRMVLSIN